MLIIKLLCLPITLYQLFISPALAPCCRYEPSCSEYVKDSLKTHGLLKGLYLSIKRLLRCHPFGGYGFDPVPQKNAFHKIGKTK